MENQDEKLIKKFWMNEKQILEYAKKRDDLWEYDDDCLINHVKQYNRIWDIDDCLDEFSHFTY